MSNDKALVRAPETPLAPPRGALAEVMKLQALEGTALPDIDYRREVRRGAWLLLLGFVGFLLWATLAPLDGGIPAPGVVAVESTRKKLDHPGGGVIEHLRVREGQTVKEGDELIVLNEVQARSALNATLNQWYTAQAVLARLMAEREGLASVTFPAELLQARKSKEVADAIRAQEELFRARRSGLQGELRIIKESVRGMETQLHSLAALKTGREKQVALFNEQLGSFAQLKSEGYVSRNYLVEVERQLAEVQSRQSEDLAKIADVSTRFSELRMQGAQKEAEFRREVETQLTDFQREAATLGERLAAQRDTVARLAIRAPVSGTVVDLAFHTLGGVIKPGERILDIVPAADELIIEAQVSPQYIDRLSVGLPTDVHFDAYSTRVERPVVRGSVQVVSADVLTDPRNGSTYYTMRVKVPAAEVKKLKGLRLQPGMQSTVMVKTGESSLMVYLLHPLLRRFTSALSE